MRTDLQETIKPFQPRVFNYSLDWRFLLPMADMRKMYVVFEEDEEFSQTLAEVGVPLSNQLSSSSIKQNGSLNVQSLVFPFGLPVRWVSTGYTDQVEFFRTYRGLIDPNGYFLVGFNNAWYLRPGERSTYHASAPRRVAAQLHRAGFKLIKMFGAMPDLSIPEYIFDLNPQPMQFALHHRFRRKPAVVKILNVLARTIGLARVSRFLPCYLAVAAA